MAEKTREGKLTDLDIIELSKRITSPPELREIAAHLGVEQHLVQAAISDHNQILGAVQHVLLEVWRNRQSTPEEAYKNLEVALRAAGEPQLLGWLHSRAGGRPGIPSEERKCTVWFPREI